MLNPEHFLPVHGEYAFLKEHELLARECGVRHSTVIGNGQMLGVTPLRNGRSHGTLGNLHLLGEARLQTMFNDGGKGSGTSEDLAIEERMRIATEGIIVVDLEVFDNPPAQDAAATDAPDGERRGGGYMTARARVTSRSMWTDEVECSPRFATPRRDPCRRSSRAPGSAPWSERAPPP